MKIYWSFKESGFLTEETPNLPEDAEPITEAEHAGLLAGLEQGGEVIREDDGTLAIRARELLVTFPDRIEEATLRINQLHAAYLSTATGNATSEERDSWAVKEQAAKAVAAGAWTESDEALLLSEAEARKLSLEEFAALILEHARAYRAAIAKAGTERSRAKVSLAAIPENATPEEAQTAINTALDAMDAALFPQTPQEPNETES